MGIWGSQALGDKPVHPGFQTRTWQPRGDVLRHPAAAGLAEADPEAWLLFPHAHSDILHPTAHTMKPKICRSMAAWEVQADSAFIWREIQPAFVHKRWFTHLAGCAATWPPPQDSNRAIKPIAAFSRSQRLPVLMEAGPEWCPWVTCAPQSKSPQGFPFSAPRKETFAYLVRQ